MSKINIIISIIFIISFLGISTAQVEQEANNEKNSPDTSALKETKQLEKELVNMIKNILKDKIQQKPASDKIKQDIKVTAQRPKPEKFKIEKLRVEFAEWKGKSSSFIDILKEEKLLEVEKEFTAKFKKLEEKALKAEKVIMNPGRKPHNEREVERIMEAFEQEVNKLTKEYERKISKTEKEFEHEKDTVNKVIKEIENALSASKRSRK